MIVRGITQMVGHQLADARRRSGLSLQDLSSRTKIPVSRLQALEAGIYELLPPPIFSRGYVRACARELGIDPEAAVRQYDEERPVPAPAAVVASAPSSADEQVSAWAASKGALLSTFGIVAVAILIWTGRDPSGTAVGPVVDARTRAAPTASPSPVGTTGDGVSVGAHDGVSVTLTAERVCWITATADGRRAVYRLVQPGEKVVLNAREEVAVRAGDAGALTVSVNGSAPQAVGANGEVRTLTFGAEPRDVPRRSM